MALPADTAVETAIATIEQALNNDPTIANYREAVDSWLYALGYIEKLGGSGYDALTQDAYANIRGAT